MTDYLSDIQTVIHNWEDIPVEVQQQIVQALANSTFYKRIVAAVHTVNLVHEWIDPSEIKEALEKVVEANTDTSVARTPRRPGVAKKIAKIFTDRKNEYVSLGELSTYIARGDTNSATARKYASSMVSWFNSQLSSLGIQLEIASENSNRYRDRQTWYHFRRTRF